MKKKAAAVLCAAAMLLPAAPAGAAEAPPAALVEAMRQELGRVFSSFVAPRFTVLAEDDLDPQLRAAALEMQAEQLPRVRALMERWLDEEISAGTLGAFNRMMARVVNEFALWGRDSTGPAFDDALTQVLKSPGLCRPISFKGGEMAKRLARWRFLPAELRPAALKSERELLARWGQTRTVSDVEPLPAEEMLLQLRAAMQPLQLATVPVAPEVAYFYLGDDDDTQRDPVVTDPASRCAMHQWAGATAAQFRAGTALQVADMFWTDRRVAAAPAPDESRYPTMAAHFGARGVVTLSVEVDARGRMLKARVVKRKIEAMGLRGVRPFAFEGLLDLATLAKAGGIDWSASAPKEGTRVIEQEFQWNLQWPS